VGGNCFECGHAARWEIFSEKVSHMDEQHVYSRLHLASRYVFISLVYCYSFLNFFLGVMFIFPLPKGKAKVGSQPPSDQESSANSTQANTPWGGETGCVCKTNIISFSYFRKVFI